LCEALNRRAAGRFVALAAFRAGFFAAFVAAFFVAGIRRPFPLAEQRVNNKIPIPNRDDAIPANCAIAGPPERFRRRANRALRFEVLAQRRR
jgi:hypothetical protein